MADTTTSFVGSTGYNIPRPEYLAPYILIFLMGLTVASSNAFRSQLSNLMHRSSKEIQPIEDMAISEVKDGSESELLNKSVSIPNEPRSHLSNTKPIDMRS